MSNKTIKRSSRFKWMLNWYRRRRRSHQVLIIIGIIAALFTGGLYGIARWYIARHANEPLTWGVTFVPRYARHLEVEPKAALSAMINDLGIRHYRLVSYWNDFEKEPDQYDFSDLDWQFDMIEAAGGKISLAIGLRQPRWPECHMPTWAEIMSMKEWSVHLKEYMKVVIERYKNRPSLQSYQLENEFFMTVFGICPDHSRERLIDEYHFVKSLDAKHPVLIARSNNWIGLPVGQPRPDQFGISVYKRVWDKTFTKRYFEYPLPAWFYAGLAGATEIVTGRDMIIHELQAEPWAPNELGIKDISIEEQNKSMNAVRLKLRLQYAKATGMRTIDLWGAEWWYWRKVKASDPSLWEVVKEEITKTKEANSKLLSR